MTNHPNRSRKYTVQHTQFGVCLQDDRLTELAARRLYAELCADPNTTEAFIFDGPSQDAKIVEEFRR